MAEFIDREWTSAPVTAGLSRHLTRSGTYKAYAPDPLVGRTFVFEGSLAADITDAERHISRFDREARTLVDTEALARLMLRAESAASSRIEGLIVSPQRLLKADVARAEGDQTTDATALEVLANVDAMAHALEGSNEEITLDRLADFHRRLLEPTPMKAYAGHIRTKQNWIGGTSYNPFGAAYVPPPPEMIASLLQDLCDFSNLADLPAVAQAAIAHAQFETIHPFADGNGRTGRALIHMIFKRRGLVTRTLPPVSLILATQTNDYVAALQSTRYEGPPDSPGALASTDEWIGLFAAACVRAVQDSESFERRAHDLMKGWRDRLGPLRSDSTALALVEHLPATPIVTARSVEQALRVSFNAANSAISVLESAGILTKTRAGRRNRAFEARELVDAFTDLERQFASPDGDTRISPPARDVPARPAR